VRWLLINSEDVGDIAAMLSLAMSVGFGVTGIMLYMFTRETLKQYAEAMGATSSRNPMRGRAWQQHEAVWWARVGRGPHQVDCFFAVRHRLNATLMFS
jgi:hypothetical protein